MAEIAGQKATLGGAELLGSAPVRWRLAEGVEPVIETYEVPIEAVPLYEANADLHKPLELIMQRTEVVGANNRARPGEQLKVQNVRVITAEPGPNPHIGRIQVGDLRWLMPYLRIWKQYNVRARKSVAKLIAFNDPNLAQDISQDQYLDWSINPFTAQPWTALEIIRDVLQNNTDGLNRGLLAGLLDKVEIDPDVQNLNAVSLEDIQIDGAGDDALRQALSLLPGVGLFVTVGGTFRLFNKFNATREEANVVRLGPPICGAGIIKRISNSTTRPREVHCYFPRKVEIRFNMLGAGFGDVRGSTIRSMNNVIPITDPGFVLDGGGIAAQGEWIDADVYIESLIAQAAAIGSKRLKKISRKLIDQAQIPWMGVWALIEAAGIDDLATASGDVSKFQWASRFAALKQHYLQTFRINREWTQRSRLIEAKLVGIFDTATGTRAESPVWCDYCVVPGLKSLLVDSHKGRDFSLATNKYHYPQSKEGPGPAHLPVSGDFNDPIQKDNRPSPFRVDILDDQIGLIRITPRGDVYGNWDTLIPAPVLNRPRYNPEKGHLDSISFDSQLEGQKEDTIPRLASLSARFAIIITLVPAAPNNLDQFHKIIIKPDDCKAILPQGARRGLDTAKGPIKELLIKDEVARVYWLDSLAGIYPRFFGMPGDVQGDLGDLGAPNIGNAPVDPIDRLGFGGILTLNDPIGAGQNKPFDVGVGADLFQLAQARAAQIYASEQDRLLGSQTGPLRPGIRPAGFLSEVTHVLEPDGTMLTHLQLPAAVPGLELEAFLDENTRKVINKELGA